jgi:hypothetical protein
MNKNYSLDDEAYSNAFSTMLKYHTDGKQLDNLLAERISKEIKSKNGNSVNILSVGIGLKFEVLTRKELVPLTPSF